MYLVKLRDLNIGLHVWCVPWVLSRDFKRLSMDEEVDVTERKAHGTATMWLVRVVGAYIAWPYNNLVPEYYDCNGDIVSLAERIELDKEHMHGPT